MKKRTKKYIKNQIRKYQMMAIKKMEIFYKWIITLYRWLGDTDVYSKRQIAMKEEGRGVKVPGFHEFSILEEWREEQCSWKEKTRHRH